MIINYIINHKFNENNIFMIIYDNILFQEVKFHLIDGNIDILLDLLINP